MSDARIFLCPVDFSECSEHAARYAMTLAQRMGAEVVLMHAYPVPAYFLPDGAFSVPATVMAERSERLQSHLDALRERLELPGVTVTTRLLNGTTYAEILREAKDSGAQLVVMGTHGRTGMARAWVGSVAERVVRLSPVPVITVPCHAGRATDA